MCITALDAHAHSLLTGAAFNLLVTEEDKKNMRRIEQHFNKTIPEVVYSNIACHFPCASLILYSFINAYMSIVQVAWDNDDIMEKVLKDAGLA